MIKSEGLYRPNTYKQKHKENVNPIRTLIQIKYGKLQEFRQNHI